MGQLWASSAPFCVKIGRFRCWVEFFNLGPAELKQHVCTLYGLHNPPLTFPSGGTCNFIFSARPSTVTTNWNPGE